MPIRETPSHNVVLLNQILTNQQMIIAKINKLNDNQTKLELTVNNLLCKHNINIQRIQAIESKIDTMIEPKGWIF
tara:strand:- start:503 stop:727 length:225 start_codon:yes stop_codon:yes gene_type:complete